MMGEALEWVEVAHQWYWWGPQRAVKLEGGLITDAQLVGTALGAANGSPSAGYSSTDDLTRATLPPTPLGDGQVFHAQTPGFLRCWRLEGRR